MVCIGVPGALQSASCEFVAKELCAAAHNWIGRFGAVGLPRRGTLVRVAKETCANAGGTCCWANSRRAAARRRPETDDPFVAQALARLVRAGRRMRSYARVALSARLAICFAPSRPRALGGRVTPEARHPPSLPGERVAGPATPVERVRGSSLALTVSISRLGGPKWIPSSARSRNVGARLARRPEEAPEPESRCLPSATCKGGLAEERPGIPVGGRPTNAGCAIRSRCVLLRRFANLLLGLLLRGAVRRSRRRIDRGRPGTERDARA